MPTICLHSQTTLRSGPSKKCKSTLINYHEYKQLRIAVEERLLSLDLLRSTQNLRGNLRNEHVRPNWENTLALVALPTKHALTGEWEVTNEPGT